MFFSIELPRHGERVPCLLVPQLAEKVVDAPINHQSLLQAILLRKELGKKAKEETAVYGEEAYPQRSTLDWVSKSCSKFLACREGALEGSSNFFAPTPI